MSQTAVVIVATLLLVSTGIAGESALEEIAADTALADIRASTGVVFVDLYADW